MHHKPTELSGGQCQRVAIAMARSQHPDSASIQFYICDRAQSFLHGQYAVFGRTIEGIDVMRAISEVKTGPQDKPVKSVAITGISIKLASFRRGFTGFSPPPPSSVVCKRRM